MNQRERNLAIVVAALLLVAIGMFTWNWVSSAFRKQRNLVSALDDQLEDRKLTKRQGELASERIQEYQSRSLPPDIEGSRTLYQEWLLDLIADLGFADTNVQGLLTRPNRDVYAQLAFRVSGKGDLEQVIEFLHRFYSADHLHRIGEMTLQPSRDSDELTIDAQVQSLVLPGAPPAEALRTDLSERLAQAELSAYTDLVVARNVFGPGNEPPQFGRIGRTEGHPGQKLTQRLRADDPDKSGPLLFKLLDGAPDGAEIDEESGQFSWTPDKLGDYEIKVQVTDGGVPAESDTTTFTVSVVEPREEPPDTGDAEFTYVTAITDGQQRLVWLLHRTSGRRYRLEEGDEFEAGKLRGKVGKIGTRNAQLVLGDQTLEVAVGQNLDEATKLSRESL